jgi:hypothetical protein
MTNSNANNPLQKCTTAATSPSSSFAPFICVVVSAALFCGVGVLVLVLVIAVVVVVATAATATVTLGLLLGYALSSCCFVRLTLSLAFNLSRKSGLKGVDPLRCPRH